MKTVMITGVCGVGKSTLIRGLAEQLRVPWNDYADFMLEVIKDVDRDIFPHLAWKSRREVYRAVDAILVERLAEKKEDLYLLENHLTIIHDEKIIPLDFAPYEKYRLAGLVVIEGDPLMIAERRINDLGRRRMDDTVGLISEQQEMNRVAAKKIASRLAIPHVFFVNQDASILGPKLARWISDLRR